MKKGFTNDELAEEMGSTQLLRRTHLEATLLPAEASKGVKGG
ncbi:hypothetical protein [Peribacillus cavernae]|nr:hypothetical protein [Peribacillus cavernae]MDQ0217787.1 hypothetical protein [Peribacillus cavernae]